MPKLTSGTNAKVDRRPLEIEDVTAFRLEQVEKGAAYFTEEVEMMEAVVSEKQVKKKGKKRARNSPDAGEPEASASVPSPSVRLASLGALTLGSGLSSAADTPSDNPPSISPLPDPAPDSSLLRVRIPGGLGRSSNRTESPPFSVEVPKYGGSQSCNSDKYVALESRVTELEKLVRGLESKVKKLGR